VGGLEATQTRDASQLIAEETNRRVDHYYEIVRPGEADSPIEPMAVRDFYFIAALAVALIVLWLVGRFVILPIYV
jgi:hypothetical protein